MMRNTGRWLLFLLCVLLCACGTLVDVDFGAFSMADGGGADSGSCKTCQTLGAQCGIQDDGCGNALDCGDSCPNGGTCNGMTCVCPAKSCMTLGVECGPSDDGCGNSIDCGQCAAGLSCVSGQCKCVALTCSDYMNPQCGTYPTGCGTDTINCGSTCPTGKPNCDDGVCSPTPCTPKTCKTLTTLCDTEPDGCGGTVGPCATCTSPQTCGGGGVAHACGCTAKTCAEVGNPCDAVSNGCGGTVGPCTTCTAPDTCGGGGTTGVCGCTATGKCPTGATCGTVANGCGGYVSCGPLCPVDYACVSNKCVSTGGGGCFPGDETVLMADGSQRPIDAVHVGDAILTYDERTHAFIGDTVGSVEVRGAAVSKNVLLVINGTLEVTPNHPLYTSRGSVNAEDLRIGDVLTTRTGTTLVQTLSREANNRTVYSLKPVNAVTFVVGGIVVFIKEA